MCTYLGCTVFIPGILIIALWLAGWALIVVLTCWAVFGRAVTPALLAASLAGILVWVAQ